MLVGITPRTLLCEMTLVLYSCGGGQCSGETCRNSELSWFLSWFFSGQKIVLVLVLVALRIENSLGSALGTRLLVAILIGTDNLHGKIKIVTVSFGSYMTSNVYKNTTNKRKPQLGQEATRRRGCLAFAQCLVPATRRWHRHRHQHRLPR